MFVAHQQNPSILHPKGAGKTSYDDTGATTVSTPKVAKSDKAPGTKALEKRAKAVGTDLFARAQGRSKKQLEQDAKFAASVSAMLERIGAEALSLKHEARVRAAYDKPGFKPDDYRKVIPGQDEMSRTSTTGGLFIQYKAQAAKAKSLSAKKKATIDELGIQLMRLASAMRTTHPWRGRAHDRWRQGAGPTAPDREVHAKDAWGQFGPRAQRHKAGRGELAHL